MNRLIHPVLTHERVLVVALWTAVAMFSAFSDRLDAQDADKPPAGDESTGRAAMVEETPTPSDARDLWLEGYYDRALVAYEKLADQAPKPSSLVAAVIGVARCKASVGEYDQALARLTALPPAREASVRWHTFMGQLRRIKGQYEETLRHARAAIGIDKHDADARFILASTLEYLGRRDEAIDAYRWFDRQLVERGELPPDAEWITAAAQGFYRYTMLARADVARRTKHVLTNMLQMAYEKVDRSYWPARVAAADLLRLKYNDDPDDGSVSDYAAALDINENLPASTPPLKPGGP